MLSSRCTRIRTHHGQLRPKKFLYENADHSSPRGLQNLGNTCYCNCILQCLDSIPSFLSNLNTLPLTENLHELAFVLRETLIDMNDKSIISRATSNVSLYTSFHDINSNKTIANFINFPIPVFNPNVNNTPLRLIKVLWNKNNDYGFTAGEQGDAHELFKLFLKTVKKAEADLDRKIEVSEDIVQFSRTTNAHGLDHMDMLSEIMSLPGGAQGRNTFQLSSANPSHINNEVSHSEEESARAKRTRIREEQRAKENAGHTPYSRRRGRQASRIFQYKPQKDGKTPDNERQKSSSPKNTLSPIHAMMTTKKSRDLDSRPRISPRLSNISSKKSNGTANQSNRIKLFPKEKDRKVQSTPKPRVRFTVPINGSVQELNQQQKGNIMSKMFSGDAVVTIECTTCHHRVERFENFFELSTVAMASQTLQESIRNLKRPEKLEAGNSVYCDACKMKNPSVMWWEARRIPPVLVIHRKVFPSADVKTLGIKNVPLHSVNFQKYIGGSKSIEKSLVAAVCFQQRVREGKEGLEYDQGHYTCIVRREKYFWYFIDDEDVNTIKEEKVRKILAGNGNHCPTLLFYV